MNKHMVNTEYVGRYRDSIASDILLSMKGNMYHKWIARCNAVCADQKGLHHFTQVKPLRGITGASEGPSNYESQESTCLESLQSPHVSVIESFSGQAKQVRVTVGVASIQMALQVRASANESDDVPRGERSEQVKQVNP